VLSAQIMRIGRNGVVLGRPTKRTQEVIDKISEALSYGMTQRDIADLVDVDKDTLTEWYKDPIFSVQVKQALAQRKLVRMQRIDSGNMGWQGSAWVMERCFPTEYCRPELKIAISQDVNVTVNHNVHMIAESDLSRLINLVHDVETEVMPDSALPDSDGVNATDKQE
jgi:hypothetical protein